MKLNKLAIISIVVFTLSCTEVFVEDISQEKIQLVAPANNLHTLNQDHTFIWEKIEFVDEYEFQIVSPHFDTIEFINNFDELQENFKDLNLIPGRYQWRVRALNDAGSTDYATRDLEILNSKSDSVRSGPGSNEIIK